MKFYWIKSHWLLKRLWPKYIWSVTSVQKTVYLTFDDGPVPEATPYVLQQLKRYGAKATFFCIGNNIAKNPDILSQIVADGHAIGNHTYNHINGWKTAENDYLDDVQQCDDEFLKKGIPVRLFRPPYGKIKRAAGKHLQKQGYKIIMWDVLSADFDQNISAEVCLQNVLTNVTSGSIVVFHDSIKAFRNLEYALPRTLEFLKDQGYACEVLT